MLAVLEIKLTVDQLSHAFHLSNATMYRERMEDYLLGIQMAMRFERGRHQIPAQKVSFMSGLSERLKEEARDMIRKEK